MGKLVDARKQLAVAQRLAGTTKLPFVSKLAHAIDEREAETLYAKNTGPSLPRIEKLLKGATEDVSDPRTLNNLAAARYRHAQQAAAVATWKGIAGRQPEAELNLGLHAMQVEHDPRSALAHFKRVQTSGGVRANQVRDWVDRLSQIYGDSDGERPGATK